MPMIWKYKLGETVVINEKAEGLPSDIGKKGVVYEMLVTGSYNYRIKLDNEDVVSVRENEINPLDKDDPILKYKTGNKVALKLGNYATVCHIDYLYRQMEVQFSDGSYGVINFNDIKGLCFESTSIENKTSFNQIVNILLKHYKNEDDTYTVPKELIHNLIKHISSEGEQK